MSFQHLLNGVPLATFLEGHYLKLPFASVGGCKELISLANWSTVERLLGHPDIDVVVARRHERWPVEQSPSWIQARALLAQGYTLGIRHVERCDPALAALAADFARTFQAPVDIHLYCTPAGQPGFGWHYDAEEVFLLQTQGSKDWQLRKNTVHPWPLVETMPANLRYELEIMPLLRCRLVAGDWLYIPSGYWHHAQAGEESLSLSIGVRATTALDVLDFLRQRLPASLLWRQRLPLLQEEPAPTRDDRERDYATLFAELGKDLTEHLGRPEFVRAFLDAQWAKSQQVSSSTAPAPVNGERPPVAGSPFPELPLEPQDHQSG